MGRPRCLRLLVENCHHCRKYQLKCTRGGMSCVSKGQSRQCQDLFAWQSDSAARVAVLVPSERRSHSGQCTGAVQFSSLDPLWWIGIQWQSCAWFYQYLHEMLCSSMRLLVVFFWNHSQPWFFGWPLRSAYFTRFWHRKGNHCWGRPWPCPSCPARQFQGGRGRSIFIP